MTNDIPSGAETYLRLTAEEVLAELPIAGSLQCAETEVTLRQGPLDAAHVYRLTSGAAPPTLCEVRVYHFDPEIGEHRFARVILTPALSPETLLAALRNAYLKGVEDATAEQRDFDADIAKVDAVNRGALFVIDKGDGTLLMNDLSHRPSYEPLASEQAFKLNWFRKRDPIRASGWRVREMTDAERLQWGFSEATK